MLKKTFLTLIGIAVIFSLATPAVFATNQTQPIEKSSAAPVRLTVWPGAWYFPKGWPIYGLSLGLPATSGTNEPVYGADLALLYANTDYVKGCQSAIVNKGDHLIGAQIGIVSLTKDIHGGQAAIYNSADKLDGFQLGIVNNSDKADGFQIGLVNIMDNGFLPVFILFNFSVKKNTPPDASLK